MHYYLETEMQYILVVRCVKCGNEARGGKQASAWQMSDVELGVGGRHRKDS